VRHTTIMVALATLVAACAGVDTKRLTPFTSDKQIKIDNDFAYSKTFGTSHFAYTLKSGTYFPKFRSSSGVYYEGEGRCLLEKVSIGSAQKGTLKEYDPHSFRCGIFLSNVPRVYFYRDEELSKTSADAGPIIGALNKAEMDNIHIHPYQPEPGELQKMLSLKY
jgi:hypothetical protein